jgi:hypothetical protein
MSWNSKLRLRDLFELLRMQPADSTDMGKVWIKPWVAGIALIAFIAFIPLLARVPFVSFVSLISFISLVSLRPLSTGTFLAKTFENFANCICARQNPPAFQIVYYRNGLIRIRCCWRLVFKSRIWYIAVERRNDNTVRRIAMRAAIEVTGQDIATIIRRISWRLFFIRYVNKIEVVGLENSIGFATRFVTATLIVENWDLLCRTFLVLNTELKPAWQSYVFTAIDSLFEFPDYVELAEVYALVVENQYFMAATVDCGSGLNADKSFPALLLFMLIDPESTDNSPSM